MLSYSDFKILRENKNKDDNDKLYHIIDFNKLIFILKNNKIKSYKFPYISTTRNNNLVGYVGDSPVSVFKLELNWDKLSKDYKTKPFTYVSRTNIKFTEEDEEQIQTNEIENAFKYIDRIILIKSRIEKLIDSGWFDSDGGNFKGRRMNIPTLLRYILMLMKSKGFNELYVQEGSEIKKDDDYINKILNHPIKKINHGYAYYLRGHKQVYDERFKLNVHKEIVEPIDERNKNIDQLVVGYEYDDLWLRKNYDIEKDIKTIDIPKNFDLYIFDFEYELDQIIKETDDYIHLKEAKLSNIDRIS